MVKQHFLDYYVNQGFQILPAGALRAADLPMTFVGSAGLTQVESAIEQGDSRHGEKYVLLQPCFRHFDLEKVGYSPVHLSLFNMGGAFAFGETGRQSVFTKLWQFLTITLNLDEKRLWATYFQGGQLHDYTLAPDTEALQVWKTLGLSSDQLVGVGMGSGYWKQGGGISGQERLRKCGYTSELFFDRGVEYACGDNCYPSCHCMRFVEIANILFITDRFDEMTHILHPLVTPFAETVIGVERLMMVLQAQSSVFNTNELYPFITRIEAFSQSPPVKHAVTSANIIVDHLRALLFLIADGAPPPGKGGQARIIRMLIRGILTQQKLLGITTQACLSELAIMMIEFYQAEHPYLSKSYSLFLDYITLENKRFEKTLASSYRQLDKKVLVNGNNLISGQQILTLVKQHGIPLPLLKGYLTQRGLSFNQQEYQDIYQNWRQKRLSTLA